LDKKFSAVQPDSALPRLLPIRILLVDDYEPFRNFIRLILEVRPEFQVVGEASDGSQAIWKAEKLKPDLILLDIGLPKLNGIEAARQIRQVSPDSDILFLSQNSDADVVQAALSTAARGYVLKARAATELLAAIDAILRGDRFVSPSLEKREFLDNPNTRATNRTDDHHVLAPTISRSRENRCHEVQFYSDDAVFLKRVTDFIGAALKVSHAAVVFATQPHRDGLLQGLKAKGVDVDGAIQQGAYISLDAAETLSMFMVNDWPDAVRFFDGFTKLIESALKGTKAVHPRVAVFGEGVALLWAEGNEDAAIRLEQLGNDLAETREVDILCAYPLRSPQREMDIHIFQRICAEHSAAHSQ
jgi:DNA-binding NarL/FixJ family response regulator